MGYNTEIYESQIKSLDLNIYVTTNMLFEEDLWYFSGKELPDDISKRLEVAYIEVLSMFNSGNPFMLTDCNGEPPAIGEISRGVYFCNPNLFRFGRCTLVNEHFWRKCMGGLSFIDSLYKIGDWVEGEQQNVACQIPEWERDFGLHCFKVYPDTLD